MSKSSIITHRHPLPAVASAAAGGLEIHAESFVIETGQRIELVDLTARVMAFVRRFAIQEGSVTLSSMHTTCSLLINEFQEALVADMQRFLEDVVARDRDYLHNDPDRSDCTRMNADAHLRAMLLGHAVALQISGGDVVLGQWQRVLMAELDGPRARTIRVQVWGLG